MGLTHGGRRTGCAGGLRGGNGGGVSGRVGGRHSGGATVGLVVGHISEAERGQLVGDGLVAGVEGIDGTDEVCGVVVEGSPDVGRESGELSFGLANCIHGVVVRREVGEVAVYGSPGLVGDLFRRVEASDQLIEIGIAQELALRERGLRGREARKIAGVVVVRTPQLNGTEDGAFLDAG